MKARDAVRVLVVGGAVKASHDTENERPVGSLASSLELWLWEPPAVDIASIKDVEGIAIDKLRKRSTELPASAGPMPQAYWDRKAKKQAQEQGIKRLAKREADKLRRSPWNAKKADGQKTTGKTRPRRKL